MYLIKNPSQVLIPQYHLPSKNRELPAPPIREQKLANIRVLPSFRLFF